jgi:2-keto-3-deoxy-L-arabinonate dehydratase
MLRGCIPILCTPFDQEGKVDFASLEREVDWVIEQGAEGVATLALASEGYKLLEGERDAIADSVVEKVAGRVPVVVSADGAGTEIAVDRAIRAAKLGASALMVLPSSFVKPNQVSLADYYRQIGQAVGIPVIIQDAPQLTGVSMDPALWTQLAEEVETIQYVKAEATPQGATISETIRQSDGSLAVFCGWGGLTILESLARGAVGSMPAPNFTREFVEIQRHYEAGDLERAEAEFAGCVADVLWTMQSIDHSVAAAKQELVARGIFETAFQREPRQGLDAIEEQSLQAMIGRRIATGR